jgi:hypothetical protein
MRATLARLRRLDDVAAGGDVETEPDPPNTVELNRAARPPRLDGEDLRRLPIEERKRSLACGLAVPFRSLEAMGQDQEPGGAGGVARG